jgi:iron complex outermembrane receptor protein
MSSRLAWCAATCTLVGALFSPSAGLPCAQEPADTAAAAPTPSPSPSPYRHAETVLVQAIRADRETPVTKTDLDAAELERLDHGQEMPFLLQQTPSLTFYSDNGLGAGYSYFSLRGIHQTRVNMTFDGAPLAEPEDSTLYFADFGGFAGALESVQIQRGVGTSTVGTASYGGSVNFESAIPADAVAGAAEIGVGSFGTLRGSADLHSGRLPGDVALYGRAVYQDTDGYRAHSNVRQRSLFYGAQRPGARSLFKLSGFSGREDSQLAFLASERAVLEGDPRDNPLDPAERDRFGQDVAQAQYTRFLGGSASLALQGYYNGAGGWYRIWEDPATRGSLLEYQLDWRLAGALVTFDYARGRVRFTGGLHANDFESRHARARLEAGRDYENHGHKSEANGFAKLGYDAGRWHLYADAQLRQARFRYEGDQDLGSVRWTFFNPKLGARYQITPRLGAYASLGRAAREPARMDMLAGQDNATLPYDLAAVRPESVVDVEAGLELNAPRVRLQLAAYAMEFRDEIAQTGELSEIGLPLRRNVARSHRRGLELDLLARLGRGLVLRASANLNSSRIREWTQFYDVYDEAGAYLESTGRVHADVRPLLTPAHFANLGLEWTGAGGDRLALTGRAVSSAPLDNTGDAGFRTPAFASLDASATLDLSRWLTAGRPRLRLQVNNLLDDDRIWPSGYSYLFLVRDAVGQDTLSGLSYYYPLAARSAFLSLELGF